MEQADRNLALTMSLVFLLIGMAITELQCSTATMGVFGCCVGMTMTFLIIGLDQRNGNKPVIPSELLFSLGFGSMVLGIWNIFS